MIINLFERSFLLTINCTASIPTVAVCDATGVS